MKLSFPVITRDTSRISHYLLLGPGISLDYFESVQGASPYQDADFNMRDQPLRIQRSA